MALAAPVLIDIIIKSTEIFYAVIRNVLNTKEKGKDTIVLGIEKENDEVKEIYLDYKNHPADVHNKKAPDAPVNNDVKIVEENSKLGRKYDCLR